MKKLFSLILISISLLITGCGGDSDDDLGAPVIEAIEFAPTFSPAVGLVPFPNDLFFAGTTDGTLNFPDELLSLPGYGALNALDGYSLNGSIKFPFDDPIDGNTLVAGSTVHIFEVLTDPATKAPIGFVGALVPNEDFSAGVSTATDGSRVAEITLLKPLNAKSAYLVALTSGINNTDGDSAQASADYQSIKDAIASGSVLANATLEQIKPLIGAHLAILNAIGVPADNVLVSATFSTQSTTDVLEAAAAAATPQASAISQVFAAPGVPINTSLISASLPGYADLYGGIVATPYFLSKADPLNQSWQGVGGSNLTQFNPLPVATETLNVPALVTVPNATSPWYQGFVAQSGGITPEQAGYKWPLVIFQHGITGNRTNALAIVDSYAAAGFAVISIDQPLHGITDTASPFYVPTLERTFDLDIDGDGAIDPSGTHTINLANLLVGRDNNRQASLDLHYLAKTAPTIDINGDGTPDFDGSQMHFIGQSLGAIVGTPFLGINTDVITGTLSVPGGGIAQLLRDSPSFSPTINAGLAAQGLEVNTLLYDDFFRNAQATIDAADPLSFAANAAANHPILLQKVTGDTVVPNSATDRLIAAMGLPAANQVGANPGPLGAVNFIAGGHGSLLVPTPSLAATIEMQTQAVLFAAGNPLAMLPGNGQVILIQDPTVVETQ